MLEVKAQLSITGRADPIFTDRIQITIQPAGNNHADTRFGTTDPNTGIFRTPVSFGNKDEELRFHVGATLDGIDYISALPLSVKAIELASADAVVRQPVSIDLVAARELDGVDQLSDIRQGRRRPARHPRGQADQG